MAILDVLPVSNYCVRQYRSLDLSVTVCSRCRCRSSRRKLRENCALSYFHETLNGRLYESAENKTSLIAHVMRTRTARNCNLGRVKWFCVAFCGALSPVCRTRRDCSAKRLLKIICLDTAIRTPWNLVTRRTKFLTESRETRVMSCRETRRVPGRSAFQQLCYLREIRFVLDLHVKGRITLVSSTKRIDDSSMISKSTFEF